MNSNLIFSFRSRLPVQIGKHLDCLVKYHLFHQSSEFSKKSDLKDTAFRLGKLFLL